MNIKSFVFNRNNTNTYIVSDESSHEAIIIDLGCCSDKEFDRFDRYMKDEQLIIKQCICTHLHFDHIWGITYLLDRYGIKTKASKLDEYLIEWNKMSAIFMNIDNKEKELLNYNSFIWLEHIPSKIVIGEYTFQIISTPGHSPGSVSLYNESKGVLFSGDVLFENAYGRTDLEGGDSELLKHTITSLLKFPNEVMVFPGHGPHFTVGYRKKVVNQKTR